MPGTAPTLVPVVRALLCDADTPVGAYGKLRSAGVRSFLLESVLGGERWARYSFIGVGHRARVRGVWTGTRLAVEITAGPGFTVDAELRERVARSDGLDGVRAVLEHYRADPVEGLPRFWGGLVGVFGHDLVRDIERLPGQPGDLPAFELLVTDTLVIFDNLSQQVRVVATACPPDDGEDAVAQAEQRVDAIVRRLGAPGVLPPLRVQTDLEIEAQLAPAWQGRSFPQLVEQAKEFVRLGDVFQLVLSQRFERRFEPGDLDPLSVYRTLRLTNPAPYMMVFDLEPATLVSASPEVLVRVDVDPEAGRRVTVRPIAGTRRRGRDRDEDDALEHELLSDEKERAEHLMLIDLGRNDVGRVSVAGTVSVPESFVIERYSRVMHIVSEVSGELRPELDAVDALRATFPAGTLSGAPKVRALELIDELEPAPRDWYGGAAGYLGFDGGADFAICIRSVVCVGGVMRVQAGAGLVYDSDPEAEDEECHRKASAVVRAIEMAARATGPGGEG
jgi:anthranilate synthase component 1